MALASPAGEPLFNRRRATDGGHGEICPRAPIGCLSVAMTGAAITQRITEKDIAAGQIRVPGAAKSLFPGAPDEIEVQLRGHSVTCRWNPRDLPRPRSGTIRIGHEALKRPGAAR
jgi:hypothetical protein